MLQAAPLPNPAHPGGTTLTALASRQYRPDVDGLRAIAVGTVLLFHCGLSIFSGGYVGVDVFFVISGYLISGHLAAEIAGTGRVSIAGFYERRIRRIVPALVATIVLTLAGAAWLLLPSYLVSASKAGVAAALSVSNIYLWQSANYFASDAAFQPFLHTWSLSVEEQFYLFIPILMALTGRWLNGRWLLLFGPLVLGSLALSIFATTRAPTANFFLLPTRAWELGIGALVATVPLPAIRARLAAELAGLVGLALVLAPVFLFNDATPFPGTNALYPCIGSALLIHAGAAQTSWVRRLLSTAPFVGLGKISYSLYLVHWPIIALLHFRTVAPLTPIQIVAVLAASIALATAFLRYVERPFRRATPALTRPRILAGGAAALVAAAAFGTIGIAGHGFPARFPAFAEQSIAGHTEWQPGNCFLEGNPDWHDWSLPECTRIQTGPRTILLWGDSFAAQYMPGLLAHAADLHATVIQYTAAGCPPVLSYRSYARAKCTDFNAHALEIVRDQHVGTVLLAGKWTDLRQRGLGEITTTLDALHALGVRVVMVGQSPEFAADVQVIGFLQGSKVPSAVNRWDVAFAPAMNQELRQIAGTNPFIDPMPVLCDGPLCTYQVAGSYLFEDYGHYSADGSQRMVAATLLTPGLLLP